MQKLIRGISLIALFSVSGLAAAQEDPVATYDSVLRQTRGLEAYNDLLERQIATQERQLGELQNAITQVPDLERQVPALIERMVDGLEHFVELDIPFLESERADRVAQMRTIVESTAVNDSEKFRRVLEAWEIENDYGREVNAYSGSLEIDGVSREVSFLQIGRVALLYQTQDQEEVGAWDPATRSFVPLGTEYRNSIRQALRMAQNAVAPDLVLLPVKTTE